VPSQQPNIIFLNGPSSCGKSTLTSELQEALPPPFLHFAEDHFFDMLPGQAHQRPDFLALGTRLYEGFAACAATMARAGNYLVVDTVAWNPGSMQAFTRAFKGLPVLAVGLHCDLATLEARERSRGNRGVGLARRQLATVHTEALYDIELDTSDDDTQATVSAIIDAWNQPIDDPAFVRMLRRSL
jgi:chloramphenicol 3-O phosphotransferase